MTDKPNLTRVWARTAPGGNVVDPDTVTAGKFTAGWQAEVPPFEYFNFIQKQVTEGLAHINEQGVAVWDDVTSYPVGALAKGSDGNVYKARTSQSDNDPVSDDGTNWVDWEVSNRVFRVESIAVIEALTGVAKYQVSLSGANAGVFEFSAANLSTEVTADPDQKVYIAQGSDPSGAAGAWVRQVDFYDNAASGLAGSNYQEAVDELAAGTAGTATISRSYLGNVTASYGSNATVFTAQQIESFNGNQYTAYWRVTDEVLVIAKRTLPDGSWAEYAFDGLSGRPSISIGQKDVHWNCSIGIDTNGRIVICYNTRNSAILWRYSSNTEDITAWSAEQTGMTGSSESSATYTTFVYGPSNELLCMYREGASGNGVLNLNAWSASALTWTARAHPVVTGTNTATTTNPYWWTPPITANGVLHLFWCWRESGGVETNFDMNYAKSTDGGTSWEKSDGTAYSLPITQATAEVAKSVAQGTNLLNQGHAAEDQNGNPVVAYHRDDAGGIPQLFVLRLQSGTWLDEQVTRRYLDYELTGVGARALPQARPGVVVYPDNTIVVIARDYEMGAGLAFYVKKDNGWVMRGPMTDNLNGYEPQWDRRRFLDSGALDILVVGVSDVLLEPEWNYQAPLSIWSFSALSAISSNRQGRITTVSTASATDGPIERTSTTFTDTFVAMAFSRPAFDKYPTHGRYILRMENTVNTGTISAALKVLKSSTGDTVIFASRRFTPTAAGSGGRKIIDSGWRRLPNFDNLPLDAGFMNLQLKAASGTVRASVATLMLGAFSDSVDLPVGIVT